MYINLPSLKLTCSPLKMDGWKMIFLLGRPVFRDYVSFREGTTFNIFLHKLEYQSINHTIEGSLCTTFDLPLFSISTTVLQPLTFLECNLAGF